MPDDDRGKKWVEQNSDKPNNVRITAEGLGLFAGIGIIILGLMLGYKKAQAGAYDNETIWWVFVDTALIPVALGVLIVVASIIALKLGNKDN